MIQAVDCEPVLFGLRNPHKERRRSRPATGGGVPARTPERFRLDRSGGMAPIGDGDCLDLYELARVAKEAHAEQRG